RAEMVPRAEMLASDQMLHSPNQDLRIIWFRGLRAITESEPGRAELKNLLAGKLAVPGVELRPLDRWTILTALIALNDPEAKSFFSWAGSTRLSEVNSPPKLKHRFTHFCARRRSTRICS